MAKDKIGVALVGYGLAGEVFHAPLVKATPSLEIAVITTNNPERMEKAQAAFPNAKIFASLEAAIVEGSDLFELVVIASPNKFHAPQAKAALNAGKSVVVDKPFAINSEECREIIELGKSTGKLVTVFQNRRWDNDFLTIKKLIKEKTLANIVRFESRFERFRPTLDSKKWRETTGAEEGGGLLFDLGSHLIDQACHLFGTPVSVYCELNKRRPGVESDDDAFVALEFKNGERAHIYANIASAIPGPRFRVLAMNGGYEKYGLDPQEDALRKGSAPGQAGWGVEDKSMSGKLGHEKDGGLIVDTLVSEKGQYEKFYAAVGDAIVHGEKNPVDPHDALLTIQIIELARKSAQQGTKLEFNELVPATL
ncbi:MAG: Gfo/Idh/MocA family oxidoreductase [Leptolyngbya sp.]|nr:Gfo/Idh/MocA family oxidoreductase [Candidatus Melainabacteria bacterium]